MVGKVTCRESVCLSHPRPSSLQSLLVGVPPSCSLAKVSSLSDASDSSSEIFEFHLCNRNRASSNISMASRFNSLASSVVGAPDIRSSTYRLLRISGTLVGY